MAKSKAKSCKGCLYYSSQLKANSSNPVCVGLIRSLPEVPQIDDGQSKKIDAYKNERKLGEFRYACAGYSLYFDRKGDNSKGQATQTELPACIYGVAILMDTPVHSASTPVMKTHNKQDDNGLPQRQSPSPIPTNANGEEFISRFNRNARLVANGVAKNMRRVGNQIKQSVDDALYSYRKRPK